MATRIPLSALRSALNHLYEPKLLAGSSLLGQLGLAGTLHGVNALCQTLTGAIEALKPQGGQAMQSPAWRAYEILYYRYVQQLDQQEVANQLGISTRHLKREQHTALELLAQRLHEQHGLSFDISGQAIPDELDAPETPAAAGAQPEWLRLRPDQSGVMLKDILPDVLDLVHPLVMRYLPALQVTGVETVGTLAAHPVVLRQLLLTLLTVALRHAAGGQLLISAAALPTAAEVRLQAKSAEAALPVGDDEENLAMARQLVAMLSGALVATPSPDGFSALLSVPLTRRVAVLVVDDNQDLLQLFQRYAAGTHFQIVGERDPERVTEVAAAVNPDIIILDVMMPNLDGWQLLGRLQHSPSTRSAAIILCTILPQRELALSLGCSDFLRKPVTREAFLETLNRFSSAVTAEQPD